VVRYSNVPKNDKGEEEIGKAGENSRHQKKHTHANSGGEKQITNYRTSNRVAGIFWRTECGS